MDASSKGMSLRVTCERYCRGTERVFGDRVGLLGCRLSLLLRAFTCREPKLPASEGSCVQYSAPVS